MSFIQRPNYWTPTEANLEESLKINPQRDILLLPKSPSIWSIYDTAFLSVIDASVFRNGLNKLASTESLWKKFGGSDMIRIRKDKNC